MSRPQNQPIFVNHKSDTLTVDGQTYPLEEFRRFLIHHYPLLVKKFIVKTITRSSTTVKVIGNTTEITKGGSRTLTIDWQYIFTLAVESVFIVSDFVTHKKTS